MNVEEIVAKSAQKVIENLYGQPVDSKLIQLQTTKKEFEGDLTLMVFPFVKMSKKKPEETAEEIGNALVSATPTIEKFNVIKGFLNLVIAQNAWVDALNAILADDRFGLKEVKSDAPLYMVEYSSPNTNKPLHLGHVRNNRSATVSAVSLRPMVCASSRQTSSTTVASTSASPCSHGKNSAKVRRPPLQARKAIIS